MTDIYRKWLDRLDGRTLTRGQCRALHTTILGRAYGEERYRLTMTPEEARDILDRAERTKPRITADHAAFGLDWLRRNGRPAGFPVDALDGFLEFRLDCVEVVDENAYRVIGTPRWLVVTTAGVWSYTWTPWTQHAYERQPRPVLSWRAEAPELIGVNR